MTSLVQKPDLRIVQVLTGLAGHYGKSYCIPAQKTILHLVRTHTGRAMSPRTLNRHLGALERDGWIKRIRRHTKDKTGMLVLHSTLYHILRRSAAWLNSVARAAASFFRTRAYPLASSAVSKTAQYENPITTSSSSGVAKPPPPEWKDVVERLRRANPKAKPL